MQIHQLNCYSFHFGYPGITRCLLVETGESLVLVDSGVGLRDFTNPSLLFRGFFLSNRGDRNPEQAAIRQVARLGYDPKDVRHIVQTHLHLDHAGGMRDFPWAKVHVYRPEYAAATSRRKRRLLEYAYEPAHWSHGPDWVLYDTQDGTWFDLPCARVLEDTDTQIRLVPLVGHTRGHCGVAISTPGGWLLHAGDAYIRDMQIDPLQPRSAFPRFAAPFERFMFPPQGRALLHALSRSHSHEVRVFCAHDPHSPLNDLVIGLN